MGLSLIDAYYIFGQNLSVKLDRDEFRHPYHFFIKIAFYAKKRTKILLRLTVG